jgi:hypothetical protein
MKTPLSVSRTWVKALREISPYFRGFFFFCRFRRGWASVQNFENRFCFSLKLSSAIRAVRSSGTLQVVLLMLPELISTVGDSVNAAHSVAVGQVVGVFKGRASVTGVDEVTCTEVRTVWLCDIWKWTHPAAVCVLRHEHTISTVGQPTCYFLHGHVTSHVWGMPVSLLKIMDRKFVPPWRVTQFDVSVTVAYTGEDAPFRTYVVFEISGWLAAVPLAVPSNTLSLTLFVCEWGQKKISRKKEGKKGRKKKNLPVSRTSEIWQRFGPRRHVMTY